MVLFFAFYWMPGGKWLLGLMEECGRFERQWKVRLEWRVSTGVAEGEPKMQGLKPQLDCPSTHG